MELQKQILLVEDNEHDELLTLRALRQHQLLNPVTVARDGAEALDYLFEQDLRPQVILLDLKLPKIDGLEVLRRVRENPATRALPIVILTTSNEERDMISGYDRGANSFVRKPVDFVEFAEAVRKVGLYWLVLNEVPRHAVDATKGTP